MLWFLSLCKSCFGSFCDWISFLYYVSYIFRCFLASCLAKMFRSCLSGYNICMCIVFEICTFVSVLRSIIAPYRVVLCFYVYGPLFELTLFWRHIWHWYDQLSFFAYSVHHLLICYVCGTIPLLFSCFVIAMILKYFDVILLMISRVFVFLYQWFIRLSIYEDFEY